jgi:hypothetical protein
MIAIKTHDGLYEESNKAYLMGFTPETKPRTSLVYVLHQADLMAARIEFEVEWLPKLLGPRIEKPAKETNFSLNKNNSNVKAKAMKKMANPALADIMKNL